MINPSIDDLLEIIDDRYSLVIAASKRARQIVESESFGDVRHNEKPVTAAVKEIMDGKVKHIVSE